MVDEVCATLVEAGGGHPIRLTFSIQGDVLLVDGRTQESLSDGLDADRLSLSQQILDVVTMTHDFTRQDGEVRFSASTQLRGGGVG